MVLLFQMGENSWCLSVFYTNLSQLLSSLTIQGKMRRAEADIIPAAEGKIELGLSKLEAKYYNGNKYSLCIHHWNGCLCWVLSVCCGAQNGFSRDLFCSNQFMCVRGTQTAYFTITATLLPDPTDAFLLETLLPSTLQNTMKNICMSIYCTRVSMEKRQRYFDIKFSGFFPPW